MNAKSSVSDPMVDRIFKRTMLYILIIVAVMQVLKMLDLPDSYDLTIQNVHVELSFWMAILVIVIWSDANIYIRKHHKSSSNKAYAFMSFVIAVMVIGSVILHELGHALVAAAFGNGISEAGISWWGAFVSPNGSLQEMAPIEIFLISVAGPLTNIAVALPAIVFVKFVSESLVENTVQYFGYINLRLGILNLFPMLPLFDGGKALYAVLLALGVTEAMMWWMVPLVGVILVICYKKLTKGHALNAKLAEL